MVAYHNMVQVFKVKSEQKPVFLYNTLSKSFNYRTRAASTGSLVDNNKTSNEISKDAFLFKSTKLWNSLQPSIRQESNIQKFKLKLKQWVKVNVPQ